MPKDLTTTSESPLAVSERGRTLTHTEAEVDAALKLLVLNAHNHKLTAEQLKEQGMTVRRETLKAWRELQFPRRYHQIRAELSKDVSEEIAGNAFETAMAADAAAKLYLEEAVAKLPKVPPEHLAKNFQAIVSGYNQLIEKAQTLRGEPNHIEAAIDVSDSIRELERLGVAKPVQVIDAEAVEIE